MLSKSQARAFFLGGTILFAAIFIGLTIDTIRQNDKRTNSGNLTESVKKGKQIWEDKNCMGCHTILGEGAYYAPDLTKVVETRGKEWIKIFLADPEAMFPGERKMIKYDFSEEEKNDIISFLGWVGEIDTNGWPPKPNIKFSSQTESSNNKEPNLPTPEKFSQLCIACHSLNGKGGNVGPALDYVGKKYDSEYLFKWLGNPQEVKPGTAMPKLALTENEMKEMVNFLSNLK